MDIRICILLVIIAFAELMSSGDATETDENNNELQDKSTSDSGPYQSVYNMDFMKELCRYVGVSYVRNPQDPHCKYTWCWNGYPYTMDCPPGRKIHPYFYWSDKDPCTESDTAEQCLLGLLKRVHKKKLEKEKEKEKEKEVEKDVTMVEEVHKEYPKVKSTVHDDYKTSEKYKHW